MKNRSSLKIFTTILAVLACCAFLPTMQAQLPPEIPGNPDGCYPAFTTAEGCNALHQLTGGLGNTAVGWYSNFLAGDASFNTGVGAGTLALTSRTGAGTDGDDNTAVGTAAMIVNLSGSDNTAVGTNALVNSTANGNTAVGSFAGSGVTTGSNIIAIGAFQSGVDSDLGELDDSCYIGNIAGQPVSAENFVGTVGVDSDGKLGTFAMDANGTKVPFSSLMDAQKQAMSNRKIEELQATVARQQKQIDALTAGLQKVSAQLEVSKPAPRVVTNKP